MLIEHGLDGLRRLPPGAVVTVGNFDGIHLGHRRLLGVCRELSAGKSPVVAVTFEPHPLANLRPELAPPRLTPEAVKNSLLEECGVDVLVQLEPDAQTLSTSARDFFHLLVNTLRVSHLVEGPDFSFGKGREGNLSNLRNWAEGTTMQVHAVEELEAVLTNMHIVEVRSSLIRWLLAYGRARDAAICLGRPYRLTGVIVEGFKRGRQLGMPTANFECGDQFVPADGVYAGRIVYRGVTYAAGVSIGTLPTFNESKRQVEAHLLGFDGDLYGAVLELDLIDFLREQIKFKDVEQLKDRMWRDMDRCRTMVDLNPSERKMAI